MTDSYRSNQFIWVVEMATSLSCGGLFAQGRYIIGILVAFVLIYAHFMDLFLTGGRNK